MKSASVRRLLVVSFARPGETTADLEALSEGGLVVGELSLRGTPPSAHAGAFKQALRRQEPEVILLVLAAAESLAAGTALLAAAREAEPVPPVVVAAEFAQAEAIFELLGAGADDFLTLPLRPREALTRLTLLARQRPVGDPAVARLRAKLGLSQLIGESAAFARLVAQLPRIARCESSVLLMGETGTGKELFARAVHYLSRRAGKPFVPVNCGATPADLLENEFFGHESGAFTSAGTRRGGVIQEADGGTLFLDEVDCLPPFAQVKLLRFLQDGRFRPLGAGREIAADVRIVAASNADLADAQASGRFRKDLYYRLNVIPLTLPPLRERPEDIPLLACHFAAKYAGKGAPVGRSLSRAALQKLLGHDWPGNVRELENAIERAVALAEQPLVGPADIVLGGPGEPAAEPGFQARKAHVVQQFEREYLQALLRAHEGNITKAAESAHKDRRAFWELLRKHGLCLAPAARPAAARTSAAN
jgi:two-component system response regulator GlrR